MTAQTVSRAEWLEARKALLAREKAFTAERDTLSAARRALPRVRVEADYRFHGPDGGVGLADLFGDCSQLVVYHFMYGADWSEGCPSCSFWADNFDGIGVHLAHRDTALVAVSIADYPRLAAYRQRMGWSFPWYSSAGSSFNADFGVTLPGRDARQGGETYNYAPLGERAGEMPGISVFQRDPDGGINHTYSTYARGLDMLNGAYHFLDLTPKGRDEHGLPWTMAWLRRHDAY